MAIMKIYELPWDMMQTRKMEVDSSHAPQTVVLGYEYQKMAFTLSVPSERVAPAARLDIDTALSTLS